MPRAFLVVVKLSVSVKPLATNCSPLGFEVTVLDATPNCPAAQVGARQIEGGLKDQDAITKLAERTDVLTWEIEHIDAGMLKELEQGGYNVQPSPTTLEVIQDKYTQKKMLEDAGLPVADSVDLSYIASRFIRKTNRGEHVADVLSELGSIMMIKTRRGGYDGRGNMVFRGGNTSAIEAMLGTDWTNLYAERMIAFEKELSVVAARDLKGNIAVYPIAETVHSDNICHTVMSPAEIDPKLAKDAHEIAYETLRHLGGAGIFAIEMFATDSKVIINEIAPRVHNSGHHTIEANETSQFEQHVRAITGMPLGSTAMRAPAAVMVNILGRREEPLTRDGLEAVLALPDTHPHFYGKSSRPARKIGHITVLGSSVREALAIAHKARESLIV